MRISSASMFSSASHLSLFTAASLSAFLGLGALSACDDGGGGSENENEVITSVVLTFTPTAGGAAQVYTWNDPDGDGGAAPTIDTIAGLSDGASYTATVKFENRLETPAEDITVEVADESDQHQIFFTGTGVSGPASTSTNAALVHSYADTDVNGLPIGLSNSFTARGGNANLTVTLRHMPPVNGQPAKTAAAATTVKDSGFATLGGSTDAQVTFQVAIAVP